LTYFDNVYLPPTALLAEHNQCIIDPKADFFNHISRVVCGTLLMGAMGISSLRIASYIAAKYSLRRQVTDPGSGSLISIMAFPTQAIPVLTAIAQAYVLRAFGDDARARFADASTSSTTRHFIATIFKVTTLGMASASLLKLQDRCGAQGLFNVNQISQMHVSHIAEYSS
jgi:acyl-CoA oxidase